MSTRRIPLKRIGLGMALVAAFFAMGCGNNGVTGTDNAPAFTSVNPPPFLTTGKVPGSAGIGTMVPSDADSWYTVISEAVTGGELTTLTGGRYRMRFREGSLPAGHTFDITVSERDHNVLDFQLGPHGTQFDSPVGVEVSYAGTNADPDSPNYDGTNPAFYWHNPETDHWEHIPGTNLVDAKKYRVWLPHFSRYAMGPSPNGGTADW